MNRVLRTCLLLALPLLAATLAPRSAGERGRLDPALAAALADPAHPARNADGRLKVWVRFRDKGVRPADLPQALAAVRAELSPRTLARRARVLGDAAAVDERDLPLPAAALARAEATGARLHRQSRWLNAASFLATDDQVRRLAVLTEVAEVSPVARFNRANVPTPVPTPELPQEPAARLRTGKAATAIDYGANAAAMQQANVPAAHEQLRVTGAGVVVGMLDTGFRTAHEALAHIPVLGAWDFVNDDPVVDNEGSDPVSSRSHGTMTLSTVAAFKPGQLVAPAFDAAVLLAKTEDVSQELPIEEDHWVAGLEWAEAQGADLVSSSLGYIDWYTFADLDGNSCLTTIAADLAVGRGLVIVNSAGNERARTGHLMAPADGDGVIAVGAVDAAGAVTSFSSPGPTADGRIKPDVAALGQGNRVANPNDDAGYVNASGTSFSCPLTSGVVALMLERVPDLTPAEVAEALRQTASHPSAPNNDTGWGLVNAYAAATWFGPVFTHAPLPDPPTVAGPYPVSALITARLGLGASPQLAYRAGTGPWRVTTLIPNGPPSLYSGSLPNVAGGATVQYYLTASDAAGHVSTWPPRGAASPFAFTVPAGLATAGDTPDRGAAWLDRAAPNPFNPRTTLRFGLAAAGPARLDIFDARGFRVRRLLDADLPAGDHACVWDGRGDDGRALPSGVYLARLNAGGPARQQKLHLVR